MAKNQRTRFLEVFAKGANMTQACYESKVARSTIYYLLDHDERFVEAYQVALDASTDALVAECRRRAIEGVTEPTGWYKGKPGGYVQRFGDNLLMFMIKKEIPEYRDKWEVTGAGGQPLQIILAAYGASEGQNKGYKGPTPLSKEGKDPDPGAAPAIEVEAKGV